LHRSAKICFTYEVPSSRLELAKYPKGFFFFENFSSFSEVTIVDVFVFPVRYLFLFRFDPFRVFFFSEILMFLFFFLPSRFATFSFFISVTKRRELSTPLHVFFLDALPCYPEPFPQCSKLFFPLDTSSFPRRLPWRVFGSLSHFKLSFHVSEIYKFV